MAPAAIQTENGPQPFTPEFVPGLFTEQTDRGASARWKDGNKVRWKNSLPQTIGGFTKQSVSATIKGKARRLHEWQSQDGQKWIAIGTNAKLYLLNQGTLYDITPVRRTISLTNPFATTSGSASVVVTDVGHDASLNDYVRFTGGSAVGGLTISGEYQITAVLSGSQYRITAGSNASSTTTGGGTLSAEYDISNGGEDTGLWYGWGVGTWGSGAWGTARSASTMTRNLRIWSIDNWGEDLIASPSEGAVYYWDRSMGAASRAVLVEQAPVSNQRILVSPSNRQLICLGAHNGSAPDPLLIRVSNNEDFTDFVIDVTGDALDSNTFEKRIDSGSRILGGLRTRNAILVSTDLAIHLMQPDETLVYDLRQIGEGNGFIGPNAAVDVNGTVYYMAPNKFMKYDGVLEEIPCEVWTRVFGRESGQGINTSQTDKVYAWYNDAFDEVWWYYPAAGSTECDRYVIFARSGGHWSYGTISRTVGNLSGPSYGKNKPIAIDPSGNFYTHEDGDSDHDGTSAIALYAYLESYDLQLPDINGNPVHINRIVPDDKFRSGDIRITFKTKKYPESTSYTTKGPYALTSSTTNKSCRARGRQMAILIESGYTTTCRWRIGNYTYHINQDGGER